MPYLVVETHFVEGAVGENRSNPDMHRNIQQIQRRVILLQPW